MGQSGEVKDAWPISEQEFKAIRAEDKTCDNVRKISATFLFQLMSTHCFIIIKSFNETLW